ncbi:GAF domain-containing protein [Aeromicrobium sp. NPDC092404]|uniref:GAF domain-containing sensor histidine kinase n=1 Tax=Aeromicrobium sp. NPDC092404 TaxID=3154976 RepID=UPI00341CF503
MPHHAPARASDLGPALEFEGLLAQLVERADQMMRSQSRLRDLIRVNNDLTSNLDLETVLRKIVEIGTELIHAEFGAMGVIAEDQSMEQFITVGMNAETIERIGAMPEGKGLLGALIADPSPVRLAEIADDARSSGFPAHHPLMKSFLGVPIRVRDSVYGNLYLTDSKNGQFSADDEELAEALAATAGIAIANARLFEEALYREKWASALAETARRLIEDEDDQHLGFLVDRVKELADADMVSIGLVTSARTDLVIDRVVGSGADDLMGTSFSLGETVAGEAIRSGEPVLVPDAGLLDDHHFTTPTRLGDAMVIPFTIGAGGAGVLSLARLKGRADFGARDLDMGMSFASHISVSIDRAEARTTKRRVALLEDRSRIARDLHDHVIQRLFATGLSLQAVAAELAPADAHTVTEQVKEIDASIAQIRQSIFALHRDPEVTSVSLRARVLEIVDRVESQDSSSPRPQVTFLGPVDLMADAPLTDDVAAVVTEALANVVRHGQATNVEVVISAAAGRVTVEVTDDGIGPGTSPRLSGLANLRSRADSYDGSFELEPGPEGGTQLVWSVPV